ncbi:unnamed protein product, partial [Schistosoma margrebowiei]|uniref:Uncharacterized protein n=1 Tax=Schistosoma margrebowiei TaxID=48269 RepID=A0AA84ZZE9_9TREM
MGSNRKHLEAAIARLDRFQTVNITRPLRSSTTPPKPNTKFDATVIASTSTVDELVKVV